MSLIGERFGQYLARRSLSRVAWRSEGRLLEAMRMWLLSQVVSITARPSRGVNSRYAIAFQDTRCWRRRRLE